MPKNSPRRFALSAAFLEIIHDFTLALVFPGVEPTGPGEYRDRGLLESAAYRPFQTFGGQDLYVSLARKGAALFHSLISNHPFHNGNKRTAVIALDYFLLANGWSLLLPHEGTVRLAKFAASYRAHGVSDDKALAGIERTITQWIVSQRSLRKETKGVARELCDANRLIRRWIRNHPTNQIQPYDEHSR